MHFSIYIYISDIIFYILTFSGSDDISGFNWNATQKLLIAMTQNQKIIFNKLNKVEKQQFQLEKKIEEFVLNKDWYKVIFNP
jgi:hypothetical protein